MRGIQIFSSERSRSTDKVLTTFLLSSHPSSYYTESPIASRGGGVHNRILKETFSHFLFSKGDGVRFDMSFNFYHMTSRLEVK